MGKVKVKLGQTLYDIAIQCYGCPEGVFYLCDDNNLSLDTELTEGQELVIGEATPVINENNIRVKEQLSLKSIYPNSNQLPIGAGDFQATDYDNIDFNAF